MFRGPKHQVQSNHLAINRIREKEFSHQGEGAGIPGRTPAPTIVILHFDDGGTATAFDKVDCSQTVNFVLVSLPRGGNNSAVCRLEPPAPLARDIFVNFVLQDELLRNNRSQRCEICCLERSGLPTMAKSTPLALDNKAGRVCYLQVPTRSAFNYV